MSELARAGIARSAARANRRSAGSAAAVQHANHRLRPREDVGWTNVPVSVGGVTVCPGDIVIGDSDGVVVVAATEAEGVLARARAQRAKEIDRDARVKAGEPLAKILDLPPE